MADRFDECNEQEQIFITRYLQTLDPRVAALDAKYALDTARTHAYTWVRDPGCKPRVYETIKHRHAEQLKQWDPDVKELREIAYQAATADATEFVEFRRTCCRWCHGFKHQYQWTLNELAEATAAAQRMRRPLPELKGGVGYNSTRDPHPDCPECMGEGIETVRAKDTRDLSAGARRIFKGVKRTSSGGFEIVTADQEKWMRLYADLSGLNVRKTELTGKGGQPLQMPSQIILVAGTGTGGEEGGE